VNGRGPFVIIYAYAYMCAVANTSHSDSLGTPLLTLTLDSFLYGFIIVMACVYPFSFLYLNLIRSYLN